MAGERRQYVLGPGQVSEPHHPSLLANGNILLFDNGLRLRYSRVVELDPKTKQVVWEYVGDPQESLRRRKSGRLSTA